MGKYYKSTPWIVPAAPNELARIFYKYGDFVNYPKNSVIADGETLLTDIIFLKSGLLSQVYRTYDVNKPKAISIVLPKRIINYAFYLRIENDKEAVEVLRKSDVLKIPADKYRSLVKQYNLEEAMLNHCIGCIASDYDAFTCMFTCCAEIRLVYFIKSLVQSLLPEYEIPAQQSEWIEIPLKLTYQELSYVMFTTLKTIERIMHEWHKSDFIRYGHGKIIVNCKLFDLTCDETSGQQ
ncbi:Crp/Fnr family transcriptional regulator [Seleniivibrio sp.]|uniref:Crp/Fnr family transcriptional regulator n=1 Tax=Seleniivibrio sp. TaxID=2898801 RepID=UPI0025DFA543|nr:Crp/Fnr family transcriptional regulator [Seleniivibrio sp.]MCD8552376.1 Crp/Fnr family transcriptional regulator [Seleniivibrio sp.]